MTPSTSVTGSAILILVAILIIVGVAACICDRTRKQQKQAPSSYQQAVTELHPSARTSDEVSYCPYCGTPKQQFDAQFCSRCGRAFSGPEFG
ncbi:MAG: hypothetical protein RTV31_11025 [Candidatus Thorarchaeota archaeon]